MISTRNNDTPFDKKRSDITTAAKFKNLGGSGEQCRACGKRVYATERLVVEDLNGQMIFHKACFRCAHCDIKLDVSNFGSVKGVIYCQVHLKTVARPEAVRSEGFISPLANVDSNYKPGPREEEEGYSYSRDEDDEPRREAEPEVEREPERYFC